MLKKLFKGYRVFSWSMPLLLGDLLIILLLLLSLHDLNPDLILDLKVQSTFNRVSQPQHFSLRTWLPIYILFPSNTLRDIFLVMHVRNNKVAAQEILLFLSLAPMKFIKHNLENLSQEITASQKTALYLLVPHVKAPVH